MADARKIVGLVGAGLIGRGWALLFANAGYRVRVFDSDPKAAPIARQAIEGNLAVLSSEGMVEDTRALLERITFVATLDEVVRDAFYVQENVPENVEAKRRVFEALGALCGPDVILASSCSSIPPELFMEGVAARERCLIAHPFSPPHLIPLVEIITTRWTSEQALKTTEALMEELGQKPVRVLKPVIGFAVNRLQAAVINEGLNLVADGVISPGDLDLCMSHGLGLRWAFIGPFETMELNSTNGFLDYVTKYGSVYRAALDDMGISGTWSPAAIEAVERSRRAILPDTAAITARRLWRDQMLMKLAKLFRGDRLGRNSGSASSQPSGE